MLTFDNAPRLAFEGIYMLFNFQESQQAHLTQIKNYPGLVQ